MGYNWAIRERPDKSAARLVGALPTGLRGVPEAAGAGRAVALEILPASVCLEAVWPDGCTRAPGSRSGPHPRTATSELCDLSPLP